MTFNEYKALVEEHYKTDSVSRKNEIENKLFTALIALAKHLEKLYRKYGLSFINDSNWRDDRGYYEIMEFYDDEAYLNYSDRWQYGGRCDIGITIDAKYFDVEERNKKEQELKLDYISRLKTRFDVIDDRIKALYKEKSEIAEKLAKYEKEGVKQ